MVYYKNKNEQNIKKQLTKKQDPNELLNSNFKKTKKRLIINGGYKNNSNKDNINKATHNIINRNEINQLVNSITKIDNDNDNDKHNNKHNNHLQEGGYSKSKALTRILVKSYRTFNRLQYKYFPKMVLIKSKLYDVEEKKGITKIQRMVNHIIDIEERLQFLNTTTGVKETDMLKYNTAAEDLKGFKKWYGSSFLGIGSGDKWWQFDITVDRSLFSKNRVGKSDLEKRFRKLQDYIRKKLMKEITFDKVKKLTDCRNLRGYGKRHRKDTLICNINKYRKLEAKFNKYYKKFQTQYINFIKTMGLTCDQMRDYQASLGDFADPIKLGNEIKLPERFDFSLCQNYESIHVNVVDSLDKMSDKLNTEYEALKSINETSISKYNKDKMKYVKKVKNGSNTQDKIKKNQEKHKYVKEVSGEVKSGFDGLFTQFKGYVKEFNNLFIFFENLGLRRYTSNFPKIKHAKKVLKQQVKNLSENQTFISNFENMIRPLSKDADFYLDQILEPKDTDLSYEIIPKLIIDLNSSGNTKSIHMLNIDMDLYPEYATNDTSIVYIKDATVTVGGGSYGSDIGYNQNFKREMKNIYMGQGGQKEGVLVGGTSGPPPPPPPPSRIRIYIKITSGRVNNNSNIICFENLNKNYIKEYDVLFSSNRVGFKMTPVAKSGCGQKNPDGTYEKYNVIFVKNDDFINIFKYSGENIKDQSDYFTLPMLPSGMGLEHLKSFVAVNILDPTSNKTITSTGTDTLKTKYEAKSADKLKTLKENLSKFKVEQLVLPKSKLFSDKNVDYAKEIKAKLEAEMDGYKKQLQEIKMDETERTKIDELIKNLEKFAKLEQIKSIMDAFNGMVVNINGNGSISSTTEPDLIKQINDIINTDLKDANLDPIRDKINEKLFKEKSAALSGYNTINDNIQALKKLPGYENILKVDNINEYYNQFLYSIDPTMFTDLETYFNTTRSPFASGTLLVLHTLFDKLKNKLIPVSVGTSNPFYNPDTLKNVIVNSAFNTNKNLLIQVNIDKMNEFEKEYKKYLYKVEHLADIFNLRFNNAKTILNFMKNNKIIFLSGYKSNFENVINKFNSILSSNSLTMIDSNIDLIVKLEDIMIDYFKTFNKYINISSLSQKDMINNLYKLIIDNESKASDTDNQKYYYYELYENKDFIDNFCVSLSLLHKQLINFNYDNLDFIYKSITVNYTKIAATTATPATPATKALLQKVIQDIINKYNQNITKYIDTSKHTNFKLYYDIKNNVIDPSSVNDISKFLGEFQKIIEAYNQATPPITPPNIFYFMWEEDTIINAYDDVFDFSTISFIKAADLKTFSDKFLPDVKTVVENIKQMPIPSALSLKQLTIPVSVIVGGGLIGAHKKIMNGGLSLFGTKLPPPPEVNVDKGITIVATNLIGSKQSDILYYKEISNFNMTVDNKPYTGLRNAQLATLFKVIKTHTGHNPDYLCGNLGGIMDDVYNNIQLKPFQSKIKELFIATYKKLKPTDILPIDPNSEEFVKAFTDFYIINTYNPKTITTIEKIIGRIDKNIFPELKDKINPLYYSITNPPDFDNNFKNDFEDEINFSNLTNYILNLTTLSSDPDKPNIIGELETLKVLNYSQITLNTNIHKITTDKLLYSMKKDTSNPPVLYTQDKLRELFELLDMILRHFAIGRKSYIQRDIGCLSIDKHKNEDKTVSNYNVRRYDYKEEFYSLNYPSFIEVILNQKTDNYNSISPSRKPLYYSENQYSNTKSTGTSPSPLSTKYDTITPIFKKYGFSVDYTMMDVAIRLLLIPSKDVNKISGITLKNETQFVQGNYKKLSQLFATTFYNNSKLKLQERLKQILIPEIIKQTGKDSSILNENKNLKPKHIVDLLLEKQSVASKDMDGKSINILKLINIDAKNKKLIYKFYEFIMIMLKLKFYEYAITNLSTMKTEDILPPVVGGGVIERKLIGYTNSNVRNSLSKLSHKNNNSKYNLHITPKKQKKSNKRKRDENNTLYKNKRSKHSIKL